MALLRFLLAILSISVTAFVQPLYPGFYNRLCPQALPTIKHLMEEAVHCEKHMGASILCLHFHDGFVNGCDALILLDSTPKFVSEKFAVPSNNSARGSDVIDRIKFEVDRACSGSMVSCADILAIAVCESR